MKSNPYKYFMPVSVLLAATLTPLTVAEAANYTAPAAGLPGKIQLENVTLMNIDGTSGGNVGGILTAQDNLSLYNGQIFQVTGGSVATGSIDGSFSDFDGKLIISKLPQSALLIRTNVTPLQFTVTALSSNAGATGAQGPASLTGVSGSGTTNNIPFWSAGTTLGNSLITQSDASVQLPNGVQLGVGAQGNRVAFGSHNGETGMTIQESRYFCESLFWAS